MAFEIIIRPEAQLDIEASVSFYQDKSDVILRNFLKEFDTKINTISENPFIYPVVIHNKEIRKCNLYNFPFSLFYLIDGRLIIVLAVFHQKRNPKSWKKRS